MAVTSLETDNPLVKKAWEEQLFRETNKETYFSKFMGNTSDSLVQVKTQLEGKKGDKITFGIRKRLVGEGVEDDEQLVGNEEALDTADYSLTIKQYRHAVRDRGALDRQRAMFSIDEESTVALKDWGVEKIDQICFDAILSSPTRVAYKTSDTLSTFTVGTSPSAALTALTTSSKLTLDFISYIKTVCKTGKNRTFNPLRPLKIGGKKYWVLLVHPDALFDLKTSSDWKQAQREAEIRGSENPLFTGATAVWDGIIIHEHENMTIGTDAGAGANVPYAKCALLGAQSLCFAWGKRPEIVEDTFDYENQHGYAWRVMCRAGKPVFDSEDYGSVGVYVARTQVS